MSNFTVIVQDTIQLRRIKAEDLLQRLTYGHDPECNKMRGIAVHHSESFTNDDAIAWYHQIENHPCKWIIEVDGVFCGCAALKPYPEDNKAKYAIEIYDSSLYGKGIGKKVTQMVLGYAFQTIGYNKVFLRVLEFNTRAIQCYLKSGFKREGLDRQGALIDGVYHTDVYMGILLSEYKRLNLK